MPTGVPFLRSSAGIHRTSAAWLRASEDGVGRLPSLVGQRGPPSTSRGLAHRLASILAWKGERRARLLYGCRPHLLVPLEAHE
jgi:hypothetical protein